MSGLKKVVVLGLKKVVMFAAMLVANSRLVMCVK